MEAGRQREPRPTGNEEGLPFPPSLLYGSQPPAKAALRLASLGLDRAWLRSEGKCPKRRKWQGFGLAYGRSNTRRSAPDTVLKTNELTNLLTRPAFSWKGRNRTADASLFRAGLIQSARVSSQHVSALKLGQVLKRRRVGHRVSGLWRCIRWTFDRLSALGAVDTRH